MGDDAGTTIHSTAGCGVPGVVEDFGRMWKPITSKKLKKLRVCSSPASACTVSG